jgi:peptidoglycan/xylan/chitin deacetylase (PgdA/CDA1 family)
LTSNIFLKIILLVLLILSSGLFAYDSQHRQVIICFDDGYYSVYKYAYPILKKYDVPITCAIVSSYLRNGKPRLNGSAYLYLNINEVQQMIDDLNIEVASHSVSHRNFAVLSPKDIKYELTESKRVLDSLFNQETVTFVYPYGANNRYIVELTKEAGYKLGRSIRWGEPNFWTDRYLIPIKEVRMSTSVDEIVSHIKHHNTTVLLFHRIVPQPVYFTEWSQSQFKILLNRLKSDSNVEFFTLKELYQKWWQELMDKYLVEKIWLKDTVLLQKIDIDQVRTRDSSIGK